MPLLAVSTEAGAASVPSMVLVALVLYVRLPASEPLAGIDNVPELIVVRSLYEFAAISVSVPPPL